MTSLLYVGVEGWTQTNECTFIRRLGPAFALPLRFIYCTRHRTNGSAYHRRSLLLVEGAGLMTTASDIIAFSDYEPPPGVREVSDRNQTGGPCQIRTDYSSVQGTCFTD